MKEIKKSEIPETEIIGMTEAHLSRVVELERTIFPDPWPVSALKDHIVLSDWSALVAVKGDQVIGYACFKTAHGQAHLTNLATATSFRRKSVAKRLLDSILRLVGEAGCDIIRLEVRPSNEAAIAFYEKHGFTLLSRTADYYASPVEDALVMVHYMN